MSRLWHAERAQGARGFSLVSGSLAALANEPSLEERLAQAYRAGADDMRDELEAGVAADRQRLAQLIATSESLAPEPCEPLAAAIVETVRRLVADVAGNAAIDGDLLAERAHALSAAVGCDAARVIRANPADLAFLDGVGSVDVVADASVARGNLRMIEGDTILEDGVASALHRLSDALAATGLSS